MRRVVVLATLAVLACVTGVLPALAQQTTGTITGRVVDQSAAAVPGATVTATNAATGFTRAVVTDSVGHYRIAALPVGKYDLKAELSGFQTVEQKGFDVSVGQSIDIELTLKMASVAETVTVTGATPLIETTSSSVGGVVDVTKIEALPLNGRQFANLAMTVAGVGMGFHSDPTKSTQYSPQIAGGNGRNVNYQIDGGDNNDDTVGGLLQLFPLEAIEQFNMITSRYKAEYGRSNGGVMNIVTKSGQNNFGGSGFVMGRDKSLNAQTKTEEINKRAKQDYRRYQFGGSFGGPIVQNKVHFFAAAERTDQTTRQVVNTLGLFPSFDGVYDLPMDENLFTSKVSMNLSPSHYLSVRYGRNTNAQTYGVGSRTPTESWGDSKNKFNSINVNYNWVLGGSTLNEFIVQYADFQNNITARSNSPQESFPNGVSIGYNSNTPQTTIQHKWQFRDDFSWHTQGGGLGHDFKTGVNFIYEPKLYITFNSGSGAYSYSHLTLDKSGPISGISLGSAGAGVNLPMKQIALYFQDDWRLTRNLTINAGIRYDLVTGFAIDQSNVTNFKLLQAAGRAGRFSGVPGFEDWGKDAKEDYNNVQPRIGLAWDVRGNGKDLVRAGWGLYYDFGYTNANILFAGLNMVGGQGSVFQVSGVTSGIKNKDGSFFKVGDPIANITSPNEILNPNGPFFNSHVASPRILQPFTHQWSAGLSHQLTSSMVVDLDYVGTRGHDLGVRWPLNTRVNGGARRFADLGLSPASPTFDLSIGSSKFDGFTVGLRRRMDKHIQFNGWYMISRAIGLGGLGIDELTTNLVQDANDPYADVQWGPANRTDARHKVTVSAVIEAPFGINISPIYRYRSALPMHVWLGYDKNADGVSNDIAQTAYRFTGLDANNKPTWKETGACSTINCGRGAAQQQMNLRVSKVFKLPPRIHVEVIGEIFNLFNSINPAFGTGAGTAGRLFTGTAANPVTNANFMLPTGYSGDSGLPEQRVGQLGLRITF
jgi:hypothetical protein